MQYERGTAVIIWQGSHANYYEGRAPGWYAKVVLHTSQEWRAMIKSVSELRTVNAPTKFQTISDAMRWCELTMGHQDTRIAQAVGLIRPPIIEELRRSIVVNLNKYTTETAFWLIQETLIAWGQEHWHISQKLNEYEGIEPSFVSREPGQIFWNQLCKMNYASASRFKVQGAINLIYVQIEHEGKDWSSELSQLPFYSSIYTFTTAVYEWLTTCNLRAFKKQIRLGYPWTSEDSDMETVNKCLQVWGSNLGVD